MQQSTFVIINAAQWLGSPLISVKLCELIQQGLLP